MVGGSYVTITGPGNGLVGVLLIAVTTLGLNGTYAAVICSGALLLVLGFLRLGKLADYFPSSGYSRNVGSYWIDNSWQAIPHHVGQQNKQRHQY